VYRIIMVDATQIGDNVSSIYANITVIPNTGTDGFVAPIPCGATPDSDAGSRVVNSDAGVIANSAVLDVNRAGYTCIMVRDYNQSAADIDIAVDVIGWTPAGWDTDGDGIEDTDETPGCETSSDCDNNGTPDVEEEAPCAATRSCETFNGDRTGLGTHPHVSSLNIIGLKDEVDSHGKAYGLVQINAEGLTAEENVSFWRHDDEVYTADEHLGTASISSDSQIALWYAENTSVPKEVDGCESCWEVVYSNRAAADLVLGETLTVYDASAGESQQVDSDARTQIGNLDLGSMATVPVAKAQGFCGTYPEYVTGITGEDTWTQGVNGMVRSTMLEVSVSARPWASHIDGRVDLGFAPLSFWTEDGDYFGSTQVAGRDPELTSLWGPEDYTAPTSEPVFGTYQYETPKYGIKEDFPAAADIGDTIVVKDSCGGEKKITLSAPTTIR